MNFDVPIKIGDKSTIAGQEVTIRDQVHIQTFPEGSPRYLVTLGIFTNELEVNPARIHGQIFAGGEAPNLAPGLRTSASRPLWHPEAYAIFTKIRAAGRLTVADANQLAVCGYRILQEFAPEAIARGEVTDQMVADFLDIWHSDKESTK